MSTTFNKSKTSFNIYDIVSEVDKDLMEKILLDLNSKPPRDITDEKVISSLSITSLSNGDRGSVKLIDKSIGFCLRIDTKKISKKKFNAAYEEWLEKRIGELNGKEPEDDEIAEAKLEIELELAVGQHPVESYCGCIIDFYNKKIYIEKKGYLSTRILIYLNEVHKVNFKAWSPFTRELKGNVDIRDLFLSWLYLSIENDRKEIDFDNDDKIFLSNNIKFSDSDNSIHVKGNIVKFIDVYKKLLNGARVEEVNVIFNKNTTAKLTYTLKRNDYTIYNYGTNTSKYGNSQDEILVPDRLKSLNDFTLHMWQIVNYFEKNCL